MTRLRWPGRSSVRVRLTAWYVLLTGLTVIVFSGLLHLQLERTLNDQVDASLQVAASEALNDVDLNGLRPSFLKTESAQTALRRLAQAGFVVRLTASDGTVWGSFGDNQAPELKPAPGYTTLTSADVAWRAYVQAFDLPGAGTTGWLQVMRSLEAVQAASEVLLAQIVLSLPFVLLLVGLIGLFLAERALRPIDRITRTAQTISANDLAQRIGYLGVNDELGQLAQTFDRMLDRLQSGFERERRFTADASHELRTPLTAIKGRIEVTLDRLRDASEYESMLREVQKEVDRLIRLTNDLLFLARLDTGQRQAQWGTVDLSSLLEAVAEQMQTLANSREVVLPENIQGDLSVDGDADQLMRLFLNLLDNAIKYTPSAGRVTVQAERDALGVRIAISDSGPGIPQEHLSELFERFYRVEDARTRDTGGAGLGLAIAHEIVRLHGGTLEVASELGRGSTFTVRLPARAATAPADISAVTHKG